jgi:flagellar protein FlgJ
VPGVGVVLAGLSAVLIYAAFKGVDPRSLFTGVFTGNPPTPLPGIESTVGQSAAVPGAQRGNPSSVGGATPACARFVADLKATFGGDIQNVGILSVRNIAGTDTPSQHSFGNACDIFATNKEVIWAWAIRNNLRYSVRLVIYNRRQWYKGGQSAYTGSNPHTDHVHVDFWPQYGPNGPIGGKG